MASGVKVAGFAGLLRVFYLAFGTYRLDWQPIVFALAAAHAGRRLGARRRADRREAHARLLLDQPRRLHPRRRPGGHRRRACEAALFYLAAYTFMVAGSFGIVTLVGRKGDVGNSLDDYRGLSRDRPVLALAFTVFLLAQAGVPLTSGFFAKFYVITAAVEAGSTWLAIIAMVTAVIAAFLYLRIIVSMYMSADDAGEPRTIPVPFAAGLALGACARRHARRRPLPRLARQHRRGRHARPRPRSRRRPSPTRRQPRPVALP